MCEEVTEDRKVVRQPEKRGAQKRHGGTWNPTVGAGSAQAEVTQPES